MSIFYLLFTSLTILLLLLDSYFYPTFSLRRLFVDANMAFFTFSAFTLFLAAHNKLQIPKILLKFNKKYVFPSLFMISILMILIEKFQYDNFIFTFIHFNPFVFIYLPVISGIILYATSVKVENHQRLFFYLPAMLLVIIYAISLMYEKSYLFLVREDSLFESVQFVFLAIGSVYVFKLFLYFRSRRADKILTLLLLILSCGLFILAGEEISWGQRIFDISTPTELSRINAQEEFNLHNIYAINDLRHLGIIIIALYGTFSRYILEKLGSKFKRFLVLTPPYTLSFTFFLVALFYFIGSYGLYIYAQLTDIPRYIYPQSWEEVAETYLAFGLFGFTFLNFRSIKD